MLSLNDQQPDEKVLARMVEQIAHRGPDDFGYEIVGACGLGNTRLAIIDLSDAGHQPMRAVHAGGPDAWNPDVTWIAYNGEVYNFEEIRVTLQAMGHQFESQTDTETLLRAYMQFGEDNFIKAFKGMFAFAIWDVKKQKLILMRDRLGQKPLYYAFTDNWLVYGSEIKTLLAHPDISPELNHDAIPHYLAYGYPPSPETLFTGIMSLPPGHMMIVDLSGDQPAVEIKAYWEPPYPSSGPLRRTEEDIVADLLMHLRWATKVRMISDVPLGAFLSGGLDSAAIVAFMAQQSDQAVKTFAIGFEGEESFNETKYARQVATYFVTDHHEFIVKPDVIGLVDELIWNHDQPFGDSSAIPTYLVSKLAREHVTVVLTGDGSDELFAGYDRFRAARMAKQYDRLPLLAHRAIDGVVSTLPEQTTYRGIVKRANRFVRTAQMPLAQRYLDWIRYTPAEQVTGLVGAEGEAAIQDHYAGLMRSAPYTNPDVIAELLDLNMRTYLPDDLLVKVDRCSMAVGLEARSPFLDHHLVQFAAEIPVELKMRRGTSKYILKQSLRGILPDKIIDRKKHGFGVPMGTWFRNQLADYARDKLLNEKALNRGIFNPDAVREIVETHMSGKRDFGHILWTLITFEGWMQRYFD